MITYTGYDFILQGDALAKAKQLEDESVNCIVTSPPYFGLRDYGVNGQIGLEESPEQYIEKLVTLFRECRRVLKDTGTFFLNIGDSYWHNRSENGEMNGVGGNSFSGRVNHARAGGKSHEFYKPKDLMMIPARVAMALQADGWYLRSQIIWHKPNAMPESVTDRPTNDYEMVYLMSKSPKYFYDAAAIAEPYTEPMNRWGGPALKADGHSTWDLGTGQETYRTRNMRPNEKRNKRAVWSINTKPYSEAHFATMPQELADNCIKAGCPKGGVVLDPFGGAGTTAVSAISLKRHYILFELNCGYISLAQKRIQQAVMRSKQLELFDLDNTGAFYD